MDKERRCHFTSVITATLRNVWALLAILVVNAINILRDWESMDALRSSYLIYGLAALLLAVVLIFLFHLLRWRKTFIFFEGHNLIVERRLAISESRVTLRPETIASINLQQGILERLFRTYRLQFDINSSATADKTDFNLVFTMQEALKLKAELEARRQSAVAEEAAADDTAAPLTVIRKFSFGEVARHGLLSTPIWSIVYLMVFVPFIIGAMLDETIGAGITPVTVIAVIVALWPVLLQLFTPFFRYYGFTLGKRGEKVIVSYGLLTRREFTLPLDKTNALVIAQPFFARLFGLCYGEMINVGMGDSKSGTVPAFALLTGKQELAALILEVAPQFMIPDEGERSPRSALLTLSLRYGLSGLAGLGVSLFFSRWWAGALWLLLMLVCAWASWRTKELRLDADKLAITSGVLAKRTIVTFYSRLQNLNSHNGPIGRRFGIAQGHVTILANSVNRNNRIGFFPSARFDQISGGMLRHDSGGAR